MLPKAFLMSVATKAWSGYRQDKCRRVNTNLSVPADSPEPNWCGAVDFCTLDATTERADPVGILRSVSNKTIGLTPPFGLGMGQQIAVCSFFFKTGRTWELNTKLDHAVRTVTPSGCCRQC